MTVNYRTIKLKKLVNTALLFACLALSNTVQAKLLYNLIDLGTLGGTTSDGNAINNSGQVTGWAQTTDGSHYAFVTNSSGSMISLGSLPGDYSEGNGINDSGQVTGFFYTSDEPWPHAFVTETNGTMVTLHPHAYGQDINNSGLVAGTIDIPLAFVTDSSRVVIPIVTMEVDRTIGMSINKSGQVAGYAYPANENYNHAFLTDTSGTMKDLGTLGGIWSVGNAVNDTGQVTGASLAADGLKNAFITQSGGSMIDLGVVGNSSWSGGWDINNSGQVAGTLGEQFLERAFVTDNGVMVDLNSLLVASATGWTLVHAKGINDVGQITGTGVNPTGESHAFLLTPTSVPIPAAIWLFQFGLFGLLGLNRKNYLFRCSIKVVG